MSTAYQPEEDDAAPERLQLAEDAREGERARRMAEAMGLEDRISLPATEDLAPPPRGCTTSGGRCNTSTMAQPKHPPTSLRIPEATRTRVEQWATARGVPRNAAYVELIERGLKLATTSPLPTILNSAQVRSEPLLDKAGEPVKLGGIALHVDVPLKPKREFNPQPKAGKKRA